MRHITTLNRPFKNSSKCTPRKFVPEFIHAANTTNNFVPIIRDVTAQRPNIKSYT